MPENGCRFVWNGTLFLLPLQPNNPKALLMKRFKFINFKNWGGKTLTPKYAFRQGQRGVTVKKLIFCGYGQAFQLNIFFC